MAMDSSVTLIAILGLFGFIVFVLLLGESASLRHTLIGTLNNAFLEKLPKLIQKTLLFTLGHKNLHRLGSCWKYCFETRNPFLQIFFIALSSTAILGFLRYALPHIPGPYLHSLHLILIPAQITSIYAVYYVACTSDPGIITHENVHKHLEYYKYDGIIFKSKKCTTCGFQKPARSKHCSMCKACVGRSDHHCSWINRCVGENNQRYFFTFLFTLVEFCAYGAYLCVQVYRGMVIEWGLDKASKYDYITGQEIRMSSREAFMYVLDQDRVIGAIGILASVVSVVVFIFFIYQLYLASTGVTTNESFKWEFVEEAINRGEYYRIVRKPAGHSTALKEKSVETFKEERRVTSIKELKNIYDKGFRGNLKEVFFPPKF